MCSITLLKYNANNTFSNDICKQNQPASTYKSKYGNTPEVIYESSSYDPNTTNMAGLRWLPLESNPDVSNVCLNAVA